LMQKRLPNTSALVLDGVDGESLLMNLDIHGIAVSTGAACSSGNPEPSPVLLAMGLSRKEAQSSLRVSFGWGTTCEDVDHFIDVLVPIVERLRSLSK
ncbi:MAG TPA: aminotransferase class V-fold PLP-dependent enzyme, partial [Pseudobdellovibrionaceae bacterium]|nr:aminotransferase class V-fold PLP-dependent enzyme [Pseudobdellovibrionaceae bacterium]